MPSFFPPKRHLMGPGPSDVPARVLEALSRPTIGHLDPAFQDFMEEMKQGLRTVFQTDNRMTFPLSGPGTAAMEACLSNLLEPGDKILICRNGAFGHRLSEMAHRFGAKPITVDFDWGKAPDANMVEEALKADPDIMALAFVHAETSTGVRADAEALCTLARSYDCFSIIDTVTSLGGIPVEVDKWGADAVYSGTQKCLSCPPGLAPVSFSDRAVEHVRKRNTPVACWFHDLSLIAAYWDGEGGRSYHHTAPINALYGLAEAVAILLEEGLENSWSRHKKMHACLTDGLRAMGLDMLVLPDDRLPQLNTVKVPDGVDEAAVRRHLLDHFNLEIGAGLGPLAGKVWRIGLMGASAHMENIVMCLTALEDALAHQQYPIRRGAAVEAALSLNGL